MKFKGVNIFIGIVTLSVLVSIIVGFMIIGSPSQQRATSLDQQRVGDLQQISYAINSYYNQSLNLRLPSSLDELRAAQNIYVTSVIDPSTGAEYEYHTVDSLSYQLCATFETAVDTTAPGSTPAANNPGTGSTFWDHPIGHKCFDMKVTPMVKPTL